MIINLFPSSFYRDLPWRWWPILVIVALQFLFTTLSLHAADFPGMAPQPPQDNPNPVGATQARGGLSLDPSDRQSAIDFYLRYYLPTQNVALDWSGNFEACNAGEISPAFRNAVLQRINYLRAMAGVPADIVFSDAYNQKAQAAALMMSVNQQMDHFPPNNGAVIAPLAAKQLVMQTFM